MGRWGTSSNQSVPPEAIAIARGLARRRGVVGVYWGEARRGGVWTGRRCLCVHVKEKLPLDSLPPRSVIPALIGGFDTDVLAVGTPRFCAASVGPSKIVANDERRSTSSLIGKLPSGEVVALCCGHGLMPRSGTDLGRSFKRLASISTVDVRLLNGTSALAGKLVLSVLDEETDVSVVSFGTANGASALASPRVRLVPSPLLAARAVAFTSLRSPGGGEIKGVVSKELVSTQTLHGPFNLRMRYKALLVVRSDAADVAFAKEGDSGALVFTTNEKPSRCLGMVIGTDDGNQAYILPLARIEKSLGNYRGAFFR